MKNKNIILTGGYGFIGSALIRKLIKETNANVINIDKLTYAANLKSLSEVESHPRYTFIKEDICNLDSISEIFKKYKPDIVMHLDAESHVDRSISNPIEFINTNILGTFNMLEAARKYLLNEENDSFIFHHISTDEVYGDLKEGDYFTETTPYMPSSPYSSSKASSDHLVRAWGRTYKLPIIITNCSNNYGPFQNVEKLIPLTITNAISGKDIPIYGDGTQIRDWLYVDDHADALIKVIQHGEIYQTYNIGGFNEVKNIDVVRQICEILDENIKNKPDKIKSFKNLIKFIDDRPGHDERYAIDSSKIKSSLGWSPKENFKSGLEKTVLWYLKNNF